MEIEEIQCVNTLQELLSISQKTIDSKNAIIKLLEQNIELLTQNFKREIQRRSPFYINPGIVKKTKCRIKLLKKV